MRVVRDSVRRLSGLVAAGALVAAGVVAGASPAAAVATKPGAPTNVAALDGPGDHQATLTFTLPSDGGSPITSYFVTASTGASGGCSGSPCTFPSSLTDGVSVTFTVLAHNGVGAGPSSAPSNAVAPNPAPHITFTPPSSLAFGGPPIQLSATSSATGGTVTVLSGTPAVCTVDAFKVLTLVAVGTCTLAAGQPATTTHPLAITAATNITVSPGAPGAPTDLVAKAGSGEATVSFTAPTATGGVPISFYNVFPHPGGVSTVCDASPCVVKGLNNGTAYTFTATATNTAHDESSASAPSNSVTPTLVLVTIPTVTVTSSAPGSFYGQPVTFTATLTNPAVTTGAIEWSVNGTDVGPRMALTSATATFTPSPVLAVGVNTVKATYHPALGDSTHGPGSGQVLQGVHKANTTTVVAVSGDTLTATVAAVAPGAGAPTGTVAFTVGGAAAGTGTVGAGGIVTVTGTNVGTQAVVATYSGDASFQTSTGTGTGGGGTGGGAGVGGPSVTTQVTSSHAKTKYGWYRSAVQVSFACTAGSAPVVSCPGPETLSIDGADQVVTQTINGTDGGSTTVTVTGINIDTTKPHLSVLRSGHKLTCHGSDSLSGLASCKIAKHTKTKHGVKTVIWKATATDKAGNKKTKSGHFSY